MPEFKYNGRNNRGDMITGVVEAPTIDAVATQLLNTEITPIDIKQLAARDGRSFSILESLTQKAPDLDDIILFSRQMYVLMKAGVPMIRAFDGLIESTRNTIMVEAQKEIKNNIGSGHNLTTSFSKFPDLFSTLFISMVNVGENTGRLEESFMRISHYLEREKETREQIKAALRYPIFVIIAIAIAIAVINIWVIPTFANMFEKADVVLPWQTRLLMVSSALFVEWWPVMLGAIIGGILGFSFYIKTENGRFVWDRTKLKIPLAGNIIFRATLARFSRAFSMALASGVPLIQSMTVVSRAVDNEFIAERILSMRNGIERGESITNTAKLANIFTPIVLQMMAVGEETGQLDEMLAEVAEYYEREVDYDIKNLSSSIEPILIVTIGIMVLILALGVFLPMWDIAKVIK